MNLGAINIQAYLTRVDGLVTGAIITDAKDRQYRQQYTCTAEDDDRVRVQRRDGSGDAVILPATIPMDEALVAFFGLYSGDGAKGTEDPRDRKRIMPSISFSQKERHLVRFAVDQFRRVFPGEIRFTFSLGEDSAYFLDGDGKDLLDAYYQQQTGAGTPAKAELATVRPKVDAADEQYLAEIRPDVPLPNEEYLAFYYQHKDAMQAIFTDAKRRELAEVGIQEGADVKVTASLRRPFKKGARLPGGSSRSDEIHLGGLNGLGELFLKIMHEIEDSILRDVQVSSTGLITWSDTPSRVGELLDLSTFFESHPYGQLNRSRPTLTVDANTMVGQWKQSSEITLRRRLRIDPLWCYVAGLYLAEGSTPKEALFRMFAARPTGLAIGFTSSEGTSIELVLRTLRNLFAGTACVDMWKVKVGSQYFPELVVGGLKQGVPMLRGGKSGDGKLRTMEISLAIKEWALNVADAPLHGTASLLRTEYADRYSHVEPTGAGVARIDFSASSTLARWYFPLLMFAVFGSIVEDPVTGFYL